jgi:hypothetical protein
MRFLAANHGPGSLEQNEISAALHPAQSGGEVRLIYWGQITTAKDMQLIPRREPE